MALSRPNIRARLMRSMRASLRKGGIIRGAVRGRAEGRSCQAKIKCVRQILQVNISGHCCSLFQTSAEGAV